MMKTFLIVLFLVSSGITANAERYLFDCYDDLLMTTMRKNSNNPFGSVIGVEKLETKTSVVLIDTDEKKLYRWLSSRPFQELFAEEAPPSDIYSPIFIHDDLIIGQYRMKSQQYRDEFEIIAYDNVSQKLILIVNAAYGRYAKFFDCKPLN